MIKKHIQRFSLAHKLVFSLIMVLFLCAVYANLPLKGNGLSANAQEAVRLNKGAMINFVYARSAKQVPELQFKHGSGRAVSISQWRGKVVLLNLWATWCAPCRKEMPDLNALQVELGGPDFEVVAVSIDRQGVPASKKFLDQVGVKSLALYVDETGKISRDLRATGLPVTLLIGKDGTIIGRLLGPAHWASPEAKALIKQAISSGN